VRSAASAPRCSTFCTRRLRLWATSSTSRPIRSNALAHLRQGLLDPVKPSVGGGGDAFGQFLAHGLDPGGETGGDLGDPVAGAVFDHAQATVEGPASGLQFADGAGGQLFGPAQALDPGADLIDGFARAAFGFVDVAGDLADRAFQRLDRLGGARSLALQLGPAQALGQLALFDLYFLRHPFEAGGDLHLFAFGGVDPGDHFAHRALDPGDGQRLTALGGLDPVGKTFQRLGHPPDLVGGMAGGFVARRGRRSGNGHIVGRGLGEIVLRGGVLGTFVSHQPGQPLIECQAGSARQVFGQFPACRVDLPCASGSPRGHRIALPARTSDANHRFLVCKRKADAKCRVAARTLWTGRVSSFNSL
jgi:hypothetical protein